jgi:hypothetical protein
MTPTDYLAWGTLVHLVADWVFQNDWIAANKAVTGRKVPGGHPMLAHLKPGVDLLIEGREGVWDVRGRVGPDLLVGREHETQLVHVDCDSTGTYDHLTLMVSPREGPRHIASYIHALIHFLALLLVFPVAAALPLAMSHWFVDLRFALAAWRRFFGQDRGPIAQQVALWEDQVVHVALIGVAALVVGRWPS